MRIPGLDPQIDPQTQALGRAGMLPAAPSSPQKSAPSLSQRTGVPFLTLGAAKKILFEGLSPEQQDAVNSYLSANLRKLDMGALELEGKAVMTAERVSPIESQETINKFFVVPTDVVDTARSLAGRPEGVAKMREFADTFKAARQIQGQEIRNQRAFDPTKNVVPTPEERRDAGRANALPFDIGEYSNSVALGRGSVPVRAEWQGQYPEGLTTKEAAQLITNKGLGLPGADPAKAEEERIKSLGPQRSFGAGARLEDFTPEETKESIAGGLSELLGGSPTAAGIGAVVGELGGDLLSNAAKFAETGNIGAGLMVALDVLPFEAGQVFKGAKRLLSDPAKVAERLAAKGVKDAETVAARMSEAVKSVPEQELDDAINQAQAALKQADPVGVKPSPTEAVGSQKQARLPEGEQVNAPQEPVAPKASVLEPESSVKPLRPSARKAAESRVSTGGLRVDVLLKASRNPRGLDKFDDAYDEALDRAVQNELGGGVDFKEGAGYSMMEDFVNSTGRAATSTMPDGERLKQVAYELFSNLNAKVTRRGAPGPGDLAAFRKRKGKWQPDSRVTWLFGDLTPEGGAELPVDILKDLADFADGHWSMSDIAFAPYSSYKSTRRNISGLQSASRIPGLMTASEIILKEGDEVSKASRVPLIILRDYAKQLRKEAREMARGGKDLYAEVAAELRITEAELDDLLRFEDNAEQHAKRAAGADNTLEGSQGGTGSEALGDVSRKSQKQTTTTASEALDEAAKPVSGGFGSKKRGAALNPGASVDDWVRGMREASAGRSTGETTGGKFKTAARSLLWNARQKLQSVHPVLRAQFDEMGAVRDRVFTEAIAPVHTAVKTNYGRFASISAKARKELSDLPGLIDRGEFSKMNARQKAVAKQIARAMRTFRELATENGVWVERAVGDSSDAYLVGSQAQFVSGGKTRQGKIISAAPGDVVVDTVEGEFRLVDGQVFKTPQLAKDETYFPRLLDRAKIAELADSESPLRELAENFLIETKQARSTREARAKLDNLAAWGRRQSSSRLRQPRNGVRLPDAFYNDDLLEIFDWHARNASKDIAAAKVFGAGLSDLDIALKKIDKDFGPSVGQDARDAAAQLLGAAREEGAGAKAVRAFGSGEGTYQLITKLTGGTTGPLQLTQFINTLTHTGFGNSAKAAKLLFNKPLSREARLSGVTDQDILELFGAGDVHPLAKVAGEAAANVTGIKPIDRLARQHSAIAHRLATLDAIKRLKPEGKGFKQDAAYRWLTEYVGFTDDEVKRIAKDGLKQSDVDRAYQSSGRNQVRTRDEDLPGWVSEFPGGRMLARFQTFTYGQTQVFGSVVKELRKGNAMPAFRLLAGAAVIGEGVLETKARIVDMIDGAKDDGVDGFLAGFAGEGDSAEKRSKRRSELLEDLSEAQLQAIVTYGAQNLYDTGMLGLWEKIVPNYQNLPPVMRAADNVRNVGAKTLEKAKEADSTADAIKSAKYAALELLRRETVLGRRLIEPQDAKKSGKPSKPRKPGKPSRP